MGGETADYLLSLSKQIEDLGVVHATEGPGVQRERAPSRPNGLSSPYSVGPVSFNGSALDGSEDHRPVDVSSEVRLSDVQIPHADADELDDKPSTSIGDNQTVGAVDPLVALAQTQTRRTVSTMLQAPPSPSEGNGPNLGGLLPTAGSTSAVHSPKSSPRTNKAEAASGLRIVPPNSNFLSSPAGSGTGTDSTEPPAMALSPRQERVRAQQQGRGGGGSTPQHKGLLRGTLSSGLGSIGPFSAGRLSKRPSLGTDHSHHSALQHEDEFGPRLGSLGALSGSSHDAGLINPITQTLNPGDEAGKGKDLGRRINMLESKIDLIMFKLDSIFH